MAEKSIKKRNWVFILYPESAPENWREQLQGTGLPVAISPLHDKDKNPTGEPKKPHHHIILCYPGPTTYNVVSKLTAALNSTIPQPVESVNGQYRYFTHKDNPEKAPYNDRDITHLNGFNIRDYVELTASQVDALKRELITIINDLNITEYRDLINHLVVNDLTDLFHVASSQTLFLTAYLTSCRYGTKADPKKKS